MNEFSNSGWVARGSAMAESQNCDGKMQKPLAIELFSGSFGWGRGFAAQGYRVVGFDIEHLPHHGPVPEGCSQVLQDVLTLHGSQFRDAAVIVASPPCQNYSYLAMPWSRSSNPDNSKAAKALRRKWEAEGPDNRLFDACFRIQLEASEAATQAYGCAKCGVFHPATLLDGCEFEPRYIPLVVENVRGAQPWVGRSAWNYGSFHLWGDVPALMPFSNGNRKVAKKYAGPGSFKTEDGEDWRANGNMPADGVKVAGLKNGSFPPGGLAQGFIEGQKTQGGSCFLERNFHTRGVGLGVKGGGNGTWFGQSHGVEYPGQPGNARERQLERVVDLVKAHPETAPEALQIAMHGQKVSEYSDPRRNGGKGVHLTIPSENADGLKIGGDWFSDPNSTCQKHSSRSNARKAASALIARIPFALASHIAEVYKPRSPHV